MNKVRHFTFHLAMVLYFLLFKNIKQPEVKFVCPTEQEGLWRTHSF